MEEARQLPGKNEIKEKLRSFLQRNEDDLRKLHKSRAVSGIALAEKRSIVIDTLIELALNELGYQHIKGVCVAALGGYGRMEMCPYSDIDLLFLHEPDCEEVGKEVCEALLYILWDLNLDIGHSIRTIDECLDASNHEDVTILTSLMDGRYIYGDELLWELLDNKLTKELLPSISSQFIENKLDESEKRREKYGRSVYLLEPHVKEGEGGLRDIHTALWLAKAKFKLKSISELLQRAIIVERDLKTFEKGLDFLLNIRTELHYLAGRREDVLGFGWQEEVAEFLGYKDTGEIKAVERFMRIYYLYGNQIREQSKKLIDRCTFSPKVRFSPGKTVHIDNDFIIRSGVLSVTSHNIFQEYPEKMMKAFEYAYTYGHKMSAFLLDLIRDSVHLIDDNVRRNPDFNQSFLRILKESNDVSSALFEMNRIHLLGHFIPEFEKIVCLVQHDAYHVYTVDIHSIFMVQEIENIPDFDEQEFPLIKDIHTKVKNRHILYLACLLHDLGKGQGRSHSRKGALMIPKIAQRLGLSDEETQQLKFLIRRHLTMPHISQRRDMHDDTLIYRLAKSVKSLETLQLLYLLTFADIRSVGPEVWSNWKGMLLKELYLRTAAALQTDRARRESPAIRAKRLTRIVVKKLSEILPEKRILQFLKPMPDSYFSVFSPRKIAYQIQTFENLNDDMGVDVVYNRAEGFDEFSFWGKDEAGIFSKLCGVLSASGINILGARIVTRNDGRILDVFYVNQMGHSTFENMHIWDKVKKNLFNTLDGKVDVEKLVRKRKKFKPKYEKKIPTYPTRIEFDNKSSKTSTVIDIYTHDRAGLLYDITKTLTYLGLSIDYSKISTKVDQVADVFYVRDTKDGKIVQKDKLEKIRETLLSAIEET